MTRIFSIALRGFAYLLGLVVVLALAFVLFAGFTAPGARMVGNLIEKYASTPDQIVQINDPSALLTGSFKAGSIALYDSKGAYAEIRELTLDWTPTALFSKRFDAASLKAGYIRIDRLPIPSQQTEEVRSSFALPLDVKIDRFDLKEVVIGKAIAGEDQVLNAGGTVNATNSSIAATVAVAQRDRPDAKALADIVYDPAANALKLEASIDEPKGGMLARALRLPGEPAVTVRLTGDGPLSRWTGTATAALDGQEVLKLDGAHTLAPDGYRTVALNGGGTFAALLPESLRPLFQGTTAIDIAAALQDGTAFRIDRGRISTAAIDINAAGTVSTVGKNDLKVTLAGVDGPAPLRLPLAGGTAEFAVRSADLSLLGDARSAVLDLNAALDRAVLPQGTVETAALKAHSDAFNIADRSGAVTLSLTTGATRLANADLDRLIRGPLTIDGRLDVRPDAIAFDPLTIDTAATDGTLTGRYDLTNGTFATDLRLTAPADALPPAVASRTGGPVTLDGRIETGADGALSLSGLSLKAPTLDATGNLALQSGSLTGRIDATVPDIGAFAANASGRATVAADISGPLSALGIKVEAKTDQATLAGKSVTGLTIGADTTLRGGLPVGKLTANGAVDGQTVTATADLTSENGGLAIPALEATVAENRITGALTFTPDFQPNGTLNFALPNVGALASLAGQTAAGDLAGKADIVSRDGKTSVAIDATGSGLSRGDLSIVQPRAQVVISDLKNLTVEGKITADSLGQGANRATGATITLNKLGADTTIALDGTFDNAPLSLKGAVTTQGGAPSFTIQSLNAAPRGIPLELSDPKTLALDQGGVRLDNFAIQLPGGTASVTGLVGQTLDVTVAVRGNPAVEYAQPIEGGEARVAISTADITARGPMTGAVIDVKGKLAYVAVPQGRLETVGVVAHSDRFDITGRQGAIRASIDAGATRFVNADLGRLLPSPLKLDATITVAPDAVAFDPVTIDSAGLDGAVNGRFQMGDSSLRAALRLSAPPAALPAALASRFDTNLALSANVTRDAAGALNVTNIAVESGTITANGSLSLVDGQVTAATAGTLPDLGKVLADAKGSARFTLDATGPVERPLVKAEVRSSGATLAGRTLSDLVAAATVTADPENPQAAITATGALGGQAIDIRTQLATTNGRIRIPELAARIGDNRLDGSIDLTEAYEPNGTITFNLPDVGLIAAMAGERASGDLAGSATIASTNGKTSLALKASGSGIKRGDLVITKPEADITVDDLKALAIRGTAKVETIAQGANRLSNLNLAFDQKQAGLTDVRLDAVYDNAPLVFRGAIETGAARTTVRLATLSAAPRQIALKLAAPSTIIIENGTVRVSDLRIGASGGTLAVTGTAGDTLDLSVRLDRLPARLINTVSPTLGADGTIDGSIVAKGTASAPNVTYDLRWANATVAQAKSAGVGALTIVAKGGFADNSVTLDTDIRGGGGLAFRGGGRLGVTGNRPIDMKFNGDLPFSLLGPILAQNGFVLTGTAKVDAAISGAVSAPIVNGSVTTSGARLLDARRNLSINGLTANVVLAGQQARIERLTGTLSTGGSLAVTGTIGIEPSSGFPADLDIRLAKATYVDGSLLTANLDGTLKLTGPLTGSPILSGRVVIPKASITIPEKLPASLSEINIKHRNAPADVRRMQAEVQKDAGDGGTTQKSGGIGFDMTVAASRIFVRGRGVDAELGGDLVIRGTAASPAVTGGFQMKRGRLEILGKRIDFTEGTITFGGNLIPALDLDATSTAGSTTVTVNVAGLANSPNVTFSSSPALPQDEILAQLIFNRSLSKLSAVQIAQLASAVAQLAGGQGGSLFDGLRNKLGVDDLDVSTDDGGGAVFRAGRYINDRTYLELQQSSDEGAKAVINLDVGRGVKLRGEAGSEGGGAGVFYEKEY
ncbi:autotransporter secretion inner membrane protein TamB [Rhizobium sp. PP-F2F-G48]|uniref:translocation/assembly module TamB domain-containing protein n=1 Tax=Rhizobium sp. PP-F2F-G48 TaxID=2135651 RepID=UPI0010D5A53C|nr:translocation/assembly module TamB domain-containing protein [Rhizobium sp. PP-F2F-G48]TCM55137.1 autotransporter secretion inner membrane protein TamB [Rhizobium sp. PP-F2F-G48]